MGDTNETNTKVLSGELFLGMVALQTHIQKIIIFVKWAPFSYIICDRIWENQQVSEKNKFLFYCFVTFDVE